MKARILAVLAALVLSANCSAAFPERAVTLIAPFPAGGAADVIARLLARQLEVQLGKPVIVENKAGAGSVIGAAYVANAKPDGYTILLGANSTFVLNPALMPKVPYDAAVDFDAIGKMGTLGLALLVNPQVPAKKLWQWHNLKLCRCNVQFSHRFERDAYSLQGQHTRHERYDRRASPDGVRHNFGDDTATQCRPRSGSRCDQHQSFGLIAQYPYLS